MASTVIKIENSVVNFYGEQYSAGADPGFLADIGVAEAQDLPESPPIDEGPLTPEEELEALQAAAEAVEPIPDHVKPHTRKQMLLKSMSKLGQARRLTGVFTKEEFPLDDYDSAIDANEGYWEGFLRLLNRACAHCMYQGECRLEGNPDLWGDRHPHKNQNLRKDQETIEDFKKRLFNDSFAHCVPPGFPQKPPRQRTDL